MYVFREMAWIHNTILARWTRKIEYLMMMEWMM